MTILMLLTAGFLAGAINSVAAGGALIAFPAMLFAGLSPLSATITGYLTVWVGQLSALGTNHKDLLDLPKRYLTLLIPIMLGGFLGILALNHTSHDTFNTIVPWLLLLTVSLFIAQPYLQSHIHRPAHMRPQYSTIAIWAGVFGISVYAGYFAIGAGLMLLTLFGFSRIKTMHQMIALKNLAGVALTLSATIFFAVQGKIEWEYGLPLAAGSLLGGHVGARYMHRISAKNIRLLVGVIGVFVVIAAFIKF